MTAVSAVTNPEATKHEWINAMKPHDFLRDLSELSYQHGIAIAGSPELFLMQYEDYQSAYECDADSRLSFGPKTNARSGQSSALAEDQELAPVLVSVSNR